MVKKIDNYMGVYVLMSHLLVTIGILAAYLYTVVVGHPDDTLRNLAILSAGYWFGSVSFQGVQAQKKLDKVTGVDQATQDTQPVAPVQATPQTLPVQQNQTTIPPVVPVPPQQQAGGNGQ